MTGLHKMSLTDGELAVVKGYRADLAAAWSAYDAGVALEIELGLRRRAGEKPAEIAKHYKRMTVAQVTAYLQAVPAILETYKARPCMSWPDKVVELIERKPKPAKPGRSRRSPFTDFLDGKH